MLAIFELSKILHFNFCRTSSQPAALYKLAPAELYFDVPRQSEVKTLLFSARLFVINACSKKSCFQDLDLEFAQSFTEASDEYVLFYPVQHVSILTVTFPQ